MRTILLFVLTVVVTIFAAKAQPINKEITLEGKLPVLLGKINKEGLSTKNYDWFTKNYEAYAPKQDIINQLKNELNDYTITAFMGTWCGDSKKEVPRFYKILEEANFPLDRLTLVAVSRDRETYKQSPGGEEEGLTIHRVPTFIFYKDGKEVNRIVEHPSGQLEEDMLAIFQKEYTPNYHIVTMANNILAKMGVQKFNKKRKRITSKLKPYAVKFSELNTYSSVLFSSNKKEEALAIARLNIKLYPKEYYGYVNLANKLLLLKNKEEALTNYKKALVLNPDNEKVKTAINKLNQNEAN